MKSKKTSVILKIETFTIKKIRTFNRYVVGKWFSQKSHSTLHPGLSNISMLSKSARAVIRLQGCCTRQICFFLLQNSFDISPSSENTQKDKAAIVKPLLYWYLSGAESYAQIKRVQVTFLWSSQVLFISRMNAPAKGNCRRVWWILRMHDRKSDGFVQRLLIRPLEHRATKKPVLAGYIQIWLA